MRLIFNDIWINKKIFAMLFLGFVLTILPILIALSTQEYYDKIFYYSKNGKYEHYYSVTLTNMTQVNYSSLQAIAKSSKPDTSVITQNMSIFHPELGNVQVVGMLNHNWSPPLLEGTKISSDTANEVMTGSMISKQPGTLELFDKTYNITGIAGDNAGKESISVFNYTIFTSLEGLPEGIKREIEQKKSIGLLFRSDQDPTKEIQQFITKAQSITPEVRATIEDITKSYEEDKKSRAGVNEVLSYPYKLFIISLINCINISYLWIYLKRKEIALRKALGASHLQLMMHLFSQLLMCALVASGFSFLIQWALSLISLAIIDATSYDVQLNFMHIILGTFITLITAVITAIIPLLLILRTEPAQALKE